jgi:hypothetical protein
MRFNRELKERSIEINLQIENTVRNIIRCSTQWRQRFKEIQ